VLLAAAITGSDLLVQLTQMGAMGLLLKFSRTNESQADAMGTRIMNEAGYNPIEMRIFLKSCRQEAVPLAS
jgi:predicted Zn-dependent protease